MELKFNGSLVNAKIVLMSKLLDDEKRFNEAKALLLQVHAWLHAREMAQSEEWSYQDSVLAEVTPATMRQVPQKECHSIAWLLWHLTRCEDITMNLLVAQSDQVLLSGNWPEKLNIPWRDTGNAMNPEEIAHFSQTIDLDALLAYRMAVGRRTREIISHVTVDTVHQKVKAAGIQRIFNEGAVVEAARGVAEYWSKRDHAGLFLMPASRHILTHLKEAQEIRKKILRMKND
jgi:hypothetical protein